MEEKKPLKIKFKTAVVLIIMGAIILTIFGANVYASANGYGNVFFFIKYLITGEKPEISGKDELLSDRDITISYEPIVLTEKIKIQIRNLQIKDNKAKLFVAVNDNQSTEDTPLMYKVYNNENKLICEQKSSKEDNNTTEYIEELLLKEFKNDEKIIHLEIFNSKNQKLTRITINLETREVIVDGEKEAIEKISEIELKQFLGYVTSLEPNKDSEDERILFANSMLAKKEGLEVNKLDEVNKMLDVTGYQRLSNPLKNAEYFKIVNKGGTNYIEVTAGRGGFEPNTVIEIKEISYCGGLYTAKFNYTFIHEPDTFNPNHLDELEIKETTVYFRKNEDTTYSTFKVVKFEDNNVLIENNELIGSWGPAFAKENGKDISLMEVYGSFGPTGSMNFEPNGRYTAFIGAYSSENEDDMQGNYINNKSSISLIANSGKKNVLTVKEIDGEKYIEELISSSNIYVYYKKIPSNNVSEGNNSNNIVTQLTPSGFAGSSLNRVELYSNKEVYLITFDGNGFENNNIKSNELIAKNVDSIYKAEDGDIYIKGGIQVKDDLGWIHFEDGNNLGTNAKSIEYIEMTEAKYKEYSTSPYSFRIQEMVQNDNRTITIKGRVYKEIELLSITKKQYNDLINGKTIDLLGYQMKVNKDEDSDNGGYDLLITSTGNKWMKFYVEKNSDGSGKLHWYTEREMYEGTSFQEGETGRFVGTDIYMQITLDENLKCKWGNESRTLQQEYFNRKSNGTLNIKEKDDTVLPFANDEFIFQKGNCTSIIFSNI